MNRDINQVETVSKHTWLVNLKSPFLTVALDEFVMLQESSRLVLCFQGMSRPLLFARGVNQ